MKYASTRACRPAAAAAALLMFAIGAAGTALAQAGSPPPDLPIPCSAFSHNGTGGWTVRAPAMLDFGSTLVSFTVGTRFAPGSTSHGLAIPVILDRECGTNHRMRP